MSDIYWAKGSWEALGVPSPSLGFSTALHYYGLKRLEGREPELLAGIWLPA